MEGNKESSYFSTPSKMKSVVTITSHNKVVGITDLSKPLTPAHSTLQKEETGQHRHLAFWANEQELTLGSGMNLQSSGAETFHMTIGITDGILPAMPIGTACLVLDAKQMIEDGRIAAVLDLPIRTAADKKMISVDSHVETNTAKKKKKKWFTRSTKEPSKPQQIDFHSVYATDKTGDAILRIQIHLKPDEPEGSVSTTVDNTVESESRNSEVKSKSSAELQRKSSAGMQRNPSREVKHTIVDLDESVADSESESSVEDNILEANLPAGSDKGISIEEYNMFQILAQKRSSLDVKRIGVPYEEESNQKREETKEAEGSFANMFRGAMDMAISNFFTSSQPSFFSSTDVKEDPVPHEEGIEIPLPSLGLPSLTRIDETSAAASNEEDQVKYSMEAPIIQPTEGGEIDLVSASSMKSQKTESDRSNQLLEGSDKNEEPKKALTARERMVQNLEKKNQPSKSNVPVQASLQEEKCEDPARPATAPLHAEAAGSPHGQAPGNAAPPRPGRPPRPAVARPPLPPSQIRSRGREVDPNIPSSILAGPINKSWTLLDDDTYALTVEGNFQVAPKNGHPETKEGEPELYQSRQHHQSKKQGSHKEALVSIGSSRCGQPEDVPSLGGKDMAKLQQQAMKTHKVTTPTPKKPDDDEVSLRVPAVIIQYDHMSVANDELTVDTRDFLRLEVRAVGKQRNHISSRMAHRSRTMKKRPNRTIGPDDESAGSGSQDSISAFIKEVDMQLFDDEDEVESLLQL